MWPNASPRISSNEVIKESELRQQDDEEEEEPTLDSLLCRLSGKASFPRIVIRDVRAQGGGISTNQLWKQFTLSEINKNLLQPLSQQDIDFNRKSTPDLNKLPKYSFSFTPSILGEASQMLFFDLCNTSALATSFSIHLPNERYALSSRQLPFCLKVTVSVVFLRLYPIGKSSWSTGQTKVNQEKKRSFIGLSLMRSSVLRFIPRLEISGLGKRCS